MTLCSGLPSRRVEAQQEPEEQRMVGDVLLALLQEARVSRRARLAHRGGSGRAPTNRPLDVAFRLAPDPPTPYCPTPEVLYPFIGRELIILGPVVFWALYPPRDGSDVGLM